MLRSISETELWQRKLKRSKPFAISMGFPVIRKDFQSSRLSNAVSLQFLETQLAVERVGLSQIERILEKSSGENLSKKLLDSFLLISAKVSIISSKSWISDSLPLLGLWSWEICRWWRARARCAYAVLELHWRGGRTKVEGEFQLWSKPWTRAAIYHVWTHFVVLSLRWQRSLCIFQRCL